MKISYILTITCLLIMGQAGSLIAQSTEAMPSDSAEISRIILAKDSAFWTVYNSCDMNAFAEFLTEDLEFYHDKGGLLEGRAALIKTMQDGLCGNTENFSLRREAVTGTVAVFPMTKIGAIITGEHLFYINEKGKEEYLDGKARFSHIWRYADGEWRMARVLSYDHRPANGH
ncbi:DUF4440 domain-containing protein [Lewinellaceae bacterium SD302]|nr:DUF4440 domain-containing protein [Lewinellaceae bacterium SD302]